MSRSLPSGAAESREKLVVQLSPRQQPADLNASNWLVSMTTVPGGIAPAVDLCCSRASIEHRNSTYKVEKIKSFLLGIEHGMCVPPVIRYPPPDCAPRTPNPERRTPNDYYAIGAKNSTMAAARRLKHQIKSRLIHERRSTASPMKSYTIQATSPETTK